MSARRMNGVGSRIPNAMQVGYAGHSTVTRERDIGGFACESSITRYSQSVAIAAELGWHHEDAGPSSLADGGLFDSGRQTTDDRRRFLSRQKSVVRRPHQSQEATLNNAIA